MLESLFLPINSILEKTPAIAVHDKARPRLYHQRRRMQNHPQRKIIQYQVKLNFHLRRLALRDHGRRHRARHPKKLQALIDQVRPQII